MVARLTLMVTVTAAGILSGGCGPVDTVTSALGICRTSLTLRLRPGFHMPNAHGYGAAVKPAKDIPRSPTIVHVPEYPGLKRSSLPLAYPQGINYTGSPYLKTAPATFLSHASVTQLTSWYSTAFHNCGYRVSASAGIDPAAALKSGNGMVAYSSKHNPLLTVELAFDHIRQGVLVLYEAEEIVPPPRPAASYLPTDIVRIHVDGYFPDHTIVGTITNTAAIHSLVSAVNHLAVLTFRSISCIKGGPMTSYFTFYARHGHPTSVTDTVGCGAIVRVDHTRLLQDQPGGVYDTLTRLDREGFIRSE